jgi:hypothetical protein
MTRVSVRIEGHYEVHEAPFSRSYEWHPASLTLVCDCGEELTITSASTTTTCRCGTDHSALINDILINDLQEEREEPQCDEDVHPWHYDAQGQADQHLRDEAACPEDSPWRYNDITSANIKRES